MVGEAVSLSRSQQLSEKQINLTVISEKKGGLETLNLTV